MWLVNLRGSPRAVAKSIVSRKLLTPSLEKWAIRRSHSQFNPVRGMAATRPDGVGDAGEVVVVAPGQVSRPGQQKELFQLRQFR
jgi:hypothetical protein